MALSSEFRTGLVAWTGYAFGKTSFTVNTKRNALRIRPYTSVDENNIFAALRQREVRLAETSAFFSMRKRDANIAEADTNGTDIEILEVSGLRNRIA